MSASRWHRPSEQPAWIMGVLNCTPDSFSDGGKFVRDRLDVDAAVAHALQMVEQGAVIIDVGGESTRPGAKPVAEEEELARVIPVIEELASQKINVSIDTTKAGVMRQAIEAGACMVNDVSALTADPESLAVVAGYGVDVCLMHMQGEPQTMQQNPKYQHVVNEVVGYLRARVEACLQTGVKESSVVVDPGIGFGKRLQDNLELIAAIDILRCELGLPVLMGVSRKSFLAAVTGADVDSREIETAAAVSVCCFAGADMLRVHDVGCQRRAVAIGSALRDAALRIA